MNPVVAKAKAKKAATGAAIKGYSKPAGPPKPKAPPLSSHVPPPAAGGGQNGPRLNINYRDLPPDEQDQAAEKAGLHPGPGALPPGVNTPAQEAMAKSIPLPQRAPVEKGEDPAEEAKETPDQEQAENDPSMSKNEIPVPAGHHAVAAHVRRNPISQVGKAKLKARGVTVK